MARLVTSLVQAAAVKMASEASEDAAFDKLRAAERRAAMAVEAAEMAKAAAAAVRAEVKSLFMGGGSGVGEDSTEPPILLPVDITDGGCVDERALETAELVVVGRTMRIHTRPAEPVESTEEKTSNHSSDECADECADERADEGNVVVVRADWVEEMLEAMADEQTESEQAAAEPEPLLALSGTASGCSSSAEDEGAVEDEWQYV